MFGIVGLPYKNSILITKRSIKSLPLFKNGLVSKNLNIRISKKLLSTTTEATTIKQADQILLKQRAARPISPHLTIYQPQFTWYLSSLHRISGIAMGCAFFCATILFGVSGLLGLGITSEKVGEFYHNHIPKWLDYTAKGGFAYLFAFHFGNGIRHLVWDSGKGFSIKGISKGAYAVLAITAIAGTNFFMKSW